MADTFAVSTSNSALALAAGVSHGYAGFAQVDSNHFLVVSATGKARVVVVNESTFAVTAASSDFQFDSTGIQHWDCVKIDATHYLTAYTGVDSDGFCLVLEVNASTYEVTAAGSIFEFNTINFSRHCGFYAVDGNHFLISYLGGNASGTRGLAQILEVNLSTWAVSNAGAVLMLANLNSSNPVTTPITGSSDKFFASYRYTTALVRGVVLTVNTSTWAITQGTAATVSMTSGLASGACTIDENHFAITYIENNSATKVSLFEVNLTTFAVTVKDTLQIHSTTMPTNITTLNGSHALLFGGRDGSADVLAEILEFDETTWAISTTATPLTVDNGYIYSAYQNILIDETHFLACWVDTGTKIPYVQVLEVDYTPPVTDITLYETFALGEDLSDTRTFLRTFTDNLVAASNAVISNIYFAILSDSIIVSSVFSRIGTIVRVFTDSIIITSNIFKRTFQVFIDSIVTASNNVISLTKLLIESIIVSPVFARVGTIIRVFAESLVVVSTKTKTTILSFAESIVVSCNRLIAMAITIKESLVLGSSKLFAMARSFTEHIVLGATIFQRQTLTFIESFVIGDIVNKLTTIIFTESVALISDTLRVTFNGYLAGAWAAVKMIIGDDWTN